MATTYKACAKYLMVSPSKVRPVANLVRGKSYEEGKEVLGAFRQVQDCREVNNLGACGCHIGKIVRQKLQEFQFGFLLFFFCHSHNSVLSFYRL